MDFINSYAFNYALKKIEVQSIFSTEPDRLQMKCKFIQTK